MPHRKLPLIEVGFQVYAGDGREEFGAVRDVAPGGKPEIIVYVENAGDFEIPLDAVDSVHDGKVIVSIGKLGRKLREAIGHAHDAETD